MNLKLRVLLAACSVLAVGQCVSHAALTPVKAGSETSLGKLLFNPDSLAAANDDANRVDDSQDQLYSFPATAVATMLIEIAGHSSANDFGIYDPTDPSRKFVIFDGPDGPSSTKTVTFNSATKEVTYNNVTKTFGGTQFGFFLGYDDGANDQNYAYTLYSEPSKNNGAQTADAGKTGRTSAETKGDRLVTFDNWSEVTINGVAVKSAGGQKLFDRILAFEDLKTGSDYDYNDMVIGVSMTVVPEPTTVVAACLLSFGFAASLFLQWRSKRKMAAARKLEA